LNFNYVLVTKTHELLSKDWTITIQHTYKEGNAIVDWLATYGSIRDPLSRVDCIIREALTKLYLLLYYDFIGTFAPLLI
jgi:hypothetical protein